MNLPLAAQLKPNLSTATTELSSLSIALGGAERFEPGLPVLEGESVENIFGPARPAGRVGKLQLFETMDWLLGAATVPLASDLEAVANQLYADIFQATSGRHLARIWNYVPAINQSSPAGLENYRIFCRGRSLAFEHQYGRSFNALLPAASAVGTKSHSLTVAFAASRIPPRHVENPAQVPAYDYPGEYGPRAPSFARATLVRGAQRSAVFISGTAAIRGHATVAPHSLVEQLDCTRANLREISRVCGLGGDLDQGGISSRHFKIYVRHAADKPRIAAALTPTLLKPADRVSYLQADLCRAELLVEIEVSLLGVTSLPA